MEGKDSGLGGQVPSGSYLSATYKFCCLPADGFYYL
jgi:hypothetical protein